MYSVEKFEKHVINNNGGYSVDRVKNAFPKTFDSDTDAIEAIIADIDEDTLPEDVTLDDIRKDLYEDYEIAYLDMNQSYLIVPEY